MLVDSLAALGAICTVGMQGAVSGAWPVGGIRKV